MRATTMSAAMLAATALAGCLTDQPPTTPVVAAAPSPPPAPEFVWSKPGARNEEFRRTNAACLLRQIEAESANPDSLAGYGILTQCMRANGWVRVPKNKTTFGASHYRPPDLEAHP
jgi:hypothetical protein